MTRSTETLPLPIARLQRRANNARSPKDRHDAAWFAWEASLRLAASAEQGAASEELRLASLGSWRALLRREATRLDGDAFAELHAWLVTADETGDVRSRPPTTHQLLDALVLYRNQVIGHGSQRSDGFYDKVGRALLRLLQPAWSAELFLPRDARILYVESVQLESDGRVSGRIFDLHGEAPLLVERDDLVPTAELLPQRVYLFHDGRWQTLHPLVVFDEEHERLLTFNGQGRRARFLDYATGLALTGPDLEARFPGLETSLNLHFRGSPAAAAVPARTAHPEQRFGDCVLIAELGRGRSGTVWLAREEALGKFVAVKVLSENLGRDAEALARFEREIDALVRCDHGHVVRVFSRGTACGRPFYVMEFIEGASLAEIAEHLPEADDFANAVERASAARRSTHSSPRAPVASSMEPTWTAELPLDGSWRQIARALGEAARGLHHLHKRGIVHRDVCPANILIAFPRQRAVVMDLGSAMIDEQSVGLVGSAVRARWLGALRYSAPEALQRHLVDVDPRSDVYSLGAVLYELCAGRPLFDGTDERTLLQQVLRQEPVPLTTVAPRVPKRLAEIAHRALQKDPAKRQDDARMLAKELEAFATGGKGPLTESVVLPVPRARVSKAPWVWIAIAFVAIGAVAVWLAIRP